MHGFLSVKDINSNGKEGLYFALEITVKAEMVGMGIEFLRFNFLTHRLHR